MNKPIKLTQEIKDPNVLLNKFMIQCPFEKFKSGPFLLYVYKIVENKIFYFILEEDVNIQYTQERFLEDFNDYFTEMDQYII